MRISHRWLTELLPGLDVEAAALAEHLTRLGLLVEEVAPADRGLDAVVVARVLEVTAHPAADRLKVCRVAEGDGAARQIVCGAPVVREGALYLLARPGARLPGGKAIVAAEIRGVRSEGMLCSAPELGLDHLGGAEGILELESATARPGDAAAPHLLLDDTVYTVEVFSNRPDWESHLGVARELQELARDRVVLPDGGEVVEEPSAEPGVRLLDPRVCSYYSGRIVRGVRLGPSPLAVRQRLWLLGVRPINNVVDATNWVMLERGTPLHAFDLRRLHGGEVRVRRARSGERLVTLDGRERELSPEVVVIADGEAAVAVAGVIGGEATEVTGETTDVFLEAARFDPAATRLSAARLELRTEASHRFGRGVDPTAVPGGSRRAATLLQEWAGGRSVGLAEDGAAVPAPASVTLRPGRVRKLTGIEVAAERARAVLAAVDLPVTTEGERLRVDVPGWRYDLEREVDLVEEVVRRIGYEAVPVEPLPGAARVRPRGRAERTAELAQRLLGLGLDEAYTTTFVDPAPFGPGFFPGRLVQPLNPLAQSERHLRPTLAPTLALAVRYNLRRGAPGAALFEIGHVFEADVEGGGRDGGSDAAREDAAAAAREARDASAGLDDELPRLPGLRERRVVGLAMAGTPAGVHWSGGGRETPADFYDAKGIVEALVGPRRELGIFPGERAWLHPGQQAEVRIDGRPAGYVGRLHPAVERALDLDAALVVAELDLDALLRPRAAETFRPPSAFPRVERDLALIVPEEMPAAQVLARIRAAGLADLEDLRLFDLYRGDQVPAGARSLAFRLVFRNAERTLTEQEVDREMKRLVAQLAAEGLRQR